MTIKNILPRWLRICIKIILSRAPVGHLFWQKLGLFRHGLMDQVGYAQGVFDQHIERAGLKGRLEGLVIVELGPGDSLATAIIAYAHGARAILVDVGPFASSYYPIYERLCLDLAAQNLRVPDIKSNASLDQILKACNAQYLTNGLASLKEIDANSVDFIFSHAVLEHIRLDEFSNSVEQWQRILKSGGHCSHNVDLKDHLGGGLNNLRFSRRLWESEFFVKSGFYTNRLSCYEMLSAFERAKFSKEYFSSQEFLALPLKRESLSEEFQYRGDDLLIKEFNVLLTAEGAPENGNCSIAAVEKTCCSSP